MNTDYRLAVNVRHHPKCIKLKRRLGAEGVVAFFLGLLAYTAETHPDGVLRNMDTDDIAIASGWDGDAKDYVQALVEMRLLDDRDGCLEVHDWLTWNPYAAAADSRREQAEFAVAVRWENDRRQKAGDKPMTDGERASFRKLWECSRQTKTPPQNTGSIPAVILDSPISNTPTYPTIPTSPTGPTLPTTPGEPPNPPGGPAAAPPVATKASDSNFIGQYIDRFRAKFDADPILGGKERKLLKNARDVCPDAETFTRALDGFFSDDWASESGYSVECFTSQQIDRWLRARKATNGNGSSKPTTSGGATNHDDEPYAAVRIRRELAAAKLAQDAAKVVESSG